MKKVTRKYVNKAGKTIVKTYSYDRKYKKTKSGFQKAFTKKGEISKRLSARLARQGYSEAEIRTIEAYAKVKLKQGYKEWTDAQLLHSFKSDKIELMFANCGMSIKEAASEIAVDPALLLDEANWDNDTFTDPESGRSFMFEFNYEGSVWTEVTDNE